MWIFSITNAEEVTEETATEEEVTETAEETATEEVAEETTEKRKVLKLKDDFSERSKHLEFELLKANEEIKQRDDKVNKLET